MPDIPPIGEEVQVDLWDIKRSRGLIKYHTDTLNLVHAKSKYPLKKGDFALVIDSHKKDVEIIPLTPITELLTGRHLNKIDKEKCANYIYNKIIENIEKNGGIVDIGKIIRWFDKTPIENLITTDLLEKCAEKSKGLLEFIKYENTPYIAIPQVKNDYDQQKILEYKDEHAFITPAIIKTDLHWEDLRIKRVLDYLVKKGFLKVNGSYRTGTQYFFSEGTLD